jgi:hypothetical protein
MNQKLNRIRQILSALVLIAAVTGISSCDKYSFVPPSVNATDTVHFSTVVQPLFTSYCVKCHAGSNKPDLRVDRSYNYLITNDYVTLPAASSKLYSIMINTNHSSRIVEMSEADKLKILYWISQGAKDN